MRPKWLGLIVFLVAVLSAACHRRVPVTALPPPPAPAPVADRVPAPAAALAPVTNASPLDQANRAFVSGSYDEAARGYENYLRSTPSGGQRDEALFHLALIYALRPAPSTDWQRAAMMFKQLVDEYPNSPLKSPANLILSLRTELDQVSADAKLRDQRIKQLTTELDRLKKIDADRRKRP
jgi:TolA-binding protein